MSETATYLILLALIAALTFAAMNWSQNRAIRIISIVTFLAYIGSGTFLTLQAKGTPIPVDIAYSLPSGPYDVLWFGLKEGEAIFVMVDDKHGNPVSVKLPWSTDDAQKMVEADEKAKKEGGQKKICIGDPSACPQGQGGGQEDGPQGNGTQQAGAPGSGEPNGDGDGASREIWAEPPAALPPKTAG